MCIALFLWQAHPRYTFLLLHNRDEFLSRPTKAVGWWDTEGGEILGGRDEVAGGTWLGCSKHGRIAFLTNVREKSSNFPGPPPNSRGDLPLRFLKSNKDTKEFTTELLKEADRYSGFNLVFADISAKSMVYLTNRPKPEHSFVTEVSPGMHVLTNASLDSPWPKAQRLSQNFKHVWDKYGEAEIPVEEMVEKLMMNTVKDDESLLPGIYPADMEYQLSSIFVDGHSEKGRYGTRSTCVLSVKSSGMVDLYERYLDNEEWKDHTVSYQIEGESSSLSLPSFSQPSPSQTQTQQPPTQILHLRRRSSSSSSSSTLGFLPGFNWGGCRHRL